MIAKLNEEQFTRLRRMSQDGVSDKELCAWFSISMATVQRYKHESAREMSRKVVRNKSKSEKTCYKCGLPYKDHSACAKCSILIHNGQEKCDDCIAFTLNGGVRQSWLRDFA